MNAPNDVIAWVEYIAGLEKNEPDIIFTDRNKQEIGDFIDNNEGGIYPNNITQGVILPSNENDPVKSSFGTDHNNPHNDPDNTNFDIISDIPLVQMTQDPTLLEFPCPLLIITGTNENI